MVSDKIAVIGDRDTVTGFRMVGVRESTIPSTADETRKALLDYFRDPRMGLIIITEPLAEKEKNSPPRPVVGMLTDILARQHIKSDEVTFTVSYNKLIQMFNNIEESFLKLDAWNTIYNRIESE